jgi:hypothetical protein
MRPFYTSPTAGKPAANLPQQKLITLPFSVEWSKITANVEHVNWAAVATEGGTSFLTLLFLGLGCLALYWAAVKRELQANLGEWLIEDMQDFQARHISGQG